MHQRFITILALCLLLDIAGCKTPGLNTSSEVSNRVTEKLQQQGELLCDNPLPANNGPYIFDLAKCAGKYSYLDVAILPGGINDVMDADGEREFSIANSQTTKAHADKFAPKVHRRVLNLFRGANPEEKLDKVIDSIANRKTTTLRMSGVVAKALDRGSYDLTMIVPQAAVRIAPYLSIVSSGGSYIKLTEDAHFINVGYATGDNVNKDIRSGRSFGVSKGRPALDASDADYLEALETILKTDDAARFHRAIMRFLTASDPSEFAKLDGEVQIAAVDFAAVYTAELDRHIMVDLKPGKHDWQKDLVEATWVSSYVAASKKIIVKGKLVDGRPRDFFQQGTSGGGIGKTSRDRQLLSAAISRYMWSRKDNRIIDRLGKVLQVKHGDDVVHHLGLMLIDPKKTMYVLENATEITDAATEFFLEIARDAAGITKSIESA